MTESPEAYADRVLAYCMKATKTVELNDPNLKSKSQAVTKATEEPKINPIDALFDEFGQPETKARAKAVSNNPIDRMFDDFEE